MSSSLIAGSVVLIGCKCHVNLNVGSISHFGDVLFCVHFANYGIFLFNEHLEHSGNTLIFTKSGRIRRAGLFMMLYQNGEAYMLHILTGGISVDVFSCLIN